MGVDRQADPAVVEALRCKLVGGSTSLAQKYRVLFALRNISGVKAHEAMLEGEHPPRNASHPAAGRRRQARPALRRHRLRVDAHHPILPSAGLNDPSALFRHEVAYCLGQRQDPAAVATLTCILDDAAEHPM